MEKSRELKKDAKRDTLFGCLFIYLLYKFIHHLCDLRCLSYPSFITCFLQSMRYFFIVFTSHFPDALRSEVFQPESFLQLLLIRALDSFLLDKFQQI